MFAVKSFQICVKQNVVCCSCRVIYYASIHWIQRYRFPHVFAFARGIDCSLENTWKCYSHLHSIHVQLEIMRVEGELIIICIHSHLISCIHRLYSITQINVPVIRWSYPACSVSILSDISQFLILSFCCPFLTIVLVSFFFFEDAIAFRLNNVYIKIRFYD